MRLVVQRVSKAEVIRVADNIKTGEIGIGLFILVGFKKGDSMKDTVNLAAKILKLRVMSDAQSKMNLTVGDVGGKFLVVSQFTLYADTLAGNRPSFIDAEHPEAARNLYENFIEELKKGGGKVETGSFGDYMKINAELDGPVTILYT